MCPQLCLVFQPLTGIMLLLIYTLNFRDSHLINHVSPLLAGFLALAPSHGPERLAGTYVHFSNDSLEPWTVGVDRRTGLNGRLRIMDFDGKKQAWKTAGNLEPGRDRVLPPGRGLHLAPCPPAYLGFLETGEDFTGRLYLKDSQGRRILLDVARPAREGAPPVFSFVPPTCSSKVDGVLAYAYGDGELEGYAVAHIRIVSETVSPDPGPAAPEGDPGPGAGRPGPPATRP